MISKLAVGAVERVFVLLTNSIYLSVELLLRDPLPPLVQRLRVICWGKHVHIVHQHQELANWDDDLEDFHPNRVVNISEDLFIGV